MPFKGGNIAPLPNLGGTLQNVVWPAVANSWSIREVSPDPGGLARYPIKAVIIISFALLLLQALSQLVKQIEVIRGDEEALPEAEAEDPEVRV